MSNVTFDQTSPLQSTPSFYDDVTSILRENPNITWELPSVIIRIINEVNSGLAPAWQFSEHVIEQLNQFRSALNDCDNIHHLLFDTKANVQKIHEKTWDLQNPVKTMTTVMDTVRVVALDILIKGLVEFKKVFEGIAKLNRIDIKEAFPAIAGHLGILRTADVLNSSRTLYTSATKAKELYHEIHHSDTIEMDEVVKAQKEKMLNLQLARFTFSAAGITFKFAALYFAFVQLSLIAHTLYVASLSAKFLYTLEAKKKPDH